MERLSDVRVFICVAVFFIETILASEALNTFYHKTTIGDAIDMDYYAAG